MEVSNIKQIRKYLKNQTERRRQVCRDLFITSDALVQSLITNNFGLRELSYFMRLGVIKGEKMGHLESRYKRAIEEKKRGFKTEKARLSNKSTISSLKRSLERVYKKKMVA